MTCKSRLDWRKNIMIYRNPLPCLLSKYDSFQVKSVASAHHSKTEGDFVKGAGYNSSIVVLPSVRRWYVVLCQIVPCSRQWEFFGVANNCLDCKTGPCCVPSFSPKETAMLGFDPFCATGVGLELPKTWTLSSWRYNVWRCPKATDRMP